MTAADADVRFWSEFAWAEPAAPGLAGFACPNCGDLAAKTAVLSVARWAPDRTTLPREQLFRCPACDARFLQTLDRLSSGAHERNPPFRVPFYVQQTAGLEALTRLVGRLPARPVARYLDVGCAYGFTLDYARTVKQWQARGIDPSNSARQGAAALKLEIDFRLLGQTDAEQVQSGEVAPYDIISAAEVIEHIGDPPGFVALLRAMLAPGGVLALSTPNGALLAPGLSNWNISMILSDCNHVVIQTAASLAHVLRAAGFGYVAVEPEGIGLSAYASDRPIALERDPARLRRSYRDWLGSALVRRNLAPDVYLGLAGRAVVEAANDGDATAALQAWQAVWPVIERRYGFDPRGALPKIPPHAQQMLGLAPFNLGVLVYAEALARVVLGEDRRYLAGRFHEAARLCSEIEAALAGGGFPGADAQSRELGWVAAAEALVCDVARDDIVVAAKFLALAEAPDGNAERRAQLGTRLVMDAANRGYLRLAQALREVIQT